jgi:hypothetical protein
MTVSIRKAEARRTGCAFGVVVNEWRSPTALRCRNVSPLQSNLLNRRAMGGPKPPTSPRRRR